MTARTALVLAGRSVRNHPICTEWKTEYNVNPGGHVLLIWTSFRASQAAAV